MKQLSTTDAATLLGVSSRMVRLYIEHGIKTPKGTLKLKAEAITPRMYVLKQKDVEAFKKARDDLENQDKILSRRAETICKK